MRLRLFVATSSVLLTACTAAPSAVEPLSSDVVLSKAAKATQTLDSAKYILTGNINAKSSELWSTNAAIRMEGMLKDAGEQMRFQLDTEAALTTAEGNYDLDATLEVIVASETEVYMNLHSLTVQPPNPILRPDLVGKLASRWWLLPQGDNLPITGQVTPDPRLLHAQSQVVRIVKDNGVILMNGTQVYHYEVELDKEKLVSYMDQLAAGNDSFDGDQVTESLKDVVATGELWIDASSYNVFKLKWDIDGYPTSTDGKSDFNFTVSFSDHNNAPDILPPSEFKEFSPYELLGLPEDTLPQEVQLDSELELDDEAINSLLRTMDSY